MFESDETSFDPTAFPPSKLGFAEWSRAALWYLRQDPDKWPRNETRFEDDLRDGLVTVVRALSKYVTLSVTTEASTYRLTFENFNEKSAIDFKGSQAIDVVSQEPDLATDSSGQNGAKSSFFEGKEEKNMKGTKLKYRRWKHPRRKHAAIDLVSSESRSL